VEAVVIFGGEGFEGGDGFAGDGVGAGINAGFEGVHGRSGLALGGAGSGGLFCVAAIGCDLFWSRHTGRG